MTLCGEGHQLPAESDRALSNAPVYNEQWEFGLSRLAFMQSFLPHCSQTQELLAFMAFLPPPSKRSQQGRSGSGGASGRRQQQRPGSGSGEDSAPLRPHDLHRFLPEAVALIESVPQLLSSPADYLRVVAALIELLGGNSGGSGSGRGGGGGSDGKVLAAVAMMLHRRPQLLTLRQQRPHRGRDGVLAAAGMGTDPQGQQTGTSEQGWLADEVVEGGAPSAFKYGGTGCGYLEGFEGVLVTLQVEGVAGRQGRWKEGQGR